MLRFTQQIHRLKPRIVTWQTPIRNGALSYAIIGKSGIYTRYEQPPGAQRNYP